MPNLEQDQIDRLEALIQERIQLQVRAHHAKCAAEGAIRTQRGVEIRLGHVEQEIEALKSGTPFDPLTVCEQEAAGAPY